MTVPYTKAQVIQCLEALSAEIKNRMMVRWAVEGITQDPIKLLDEMIEEGRVSLPDDAPAHYGP